MTDTTPILILVAGAGAYLLMQGSGPGAPPPSAPAEPSPAPLTPATPGASILDGLATGASSLLANVGAGLGTAVGSALAASDLNDPQGEARRGLSRGADTLKTAGSILTGGAIGDPRKKRKKQRQQTSMLETDLFDAEQFAARVYAALSRGDVREWVISSRGKAGAPVVDVYYQGQAAPFAIEVPERAQHHRLAWVAEAIVRVLSRWEQRGLGPISGHFVRYDPPSFSDANPYAPPGTRISERGAGSTKYEQDTLRNLARRGRALGSKNVRRGAGLDDDQAAEEEQSP